MSEADWVAVASVAGVATAVGTIAMAIAVVLTAVYARRTLEAARADSQARTRPVIVAELQREFLAPSTILLVIRNFGASVARDVSVTFDPPPPSDISSIPMSDNWGWIYKRFEQPITTWSPGWTTSNIVRSGSDELADFTVTVNYAGPDGAPYNDVYHLHAAPTLNETYIGPSKVDDPTKLEQQKVSALQALVRTLRWGGQ